MAETPRSFRTVGERTFADNAGLKTVNIYVKDVTITADVLGECQNMPIYGYDQSMVQRYST